MLSIVDLVQGEGELEQPALLLEAALEQGQPTQSVNERCAQYYGVYLHADCLADYCSSEAKSLCSLSQHSMPSLQERLHARRRPEPGAQKGSCLTPSLGHADT